MIFIAVLVVIVFLRIFIFNIVVLDGEAMAPALESGDGMISSKVAYNRHGPQRYDIILLEATEQSECYYIKRVIGLPNEHIQITEGWC